MNYKVIISSIMDMIEGLFDTLTLAGSSIVDDMFKIAIVALVLSVILTVINLPTFISIGEGVVSLVFISLLKYSNKIRRK